MSNESSTNSELNTIRIKEPKRVLHFSDGVIEEFSSDEDVDDVPDSDQSSTENTPVPSEWIPWILYTTSSLGYKTLEVCDSIGEYLADMFGITSSKYYAEVEYYKENIKPNQMMDSTSEDHGLPNANV